MVKEMLETIEDMVEEAVDKVEEAFDKAEDAVEELVDDIKAVVSGEKKTEIAPQPAEITDEEIDAIADTAIAALQDILKYFNVGEVTIDEYEGEEGELILDITGDDLAVLIGRHGKTLDALQFLVSAITVRTIGYRYPVVIDIEGYKSRQRQKLESIARSSANKAVAQHRNVKLRPMTPYERRIVHITLRDDDRVDTVSEGEGAARHVIIMPQ